MIHKDDLQFKLTCLVVRTARGDALVRTDPRQLPRRLRVLLLAVDGRHTVNLYIHTLKGFGDISELLVELLALGLVTLKDDTPESTPENSFSQFSALDQMLDDPQFNTETAVDVLYGQTTPGSFDDMLRVAKVEVPEYKPAAAPPPAPIAPQAVKAQVESLFLLLDKTRGERKRLKTRLANMERLRKASAHIQKSNDRLKRYVYALSAACVALGIALSLCVLTRH